MANLVVVPDWDPGEARMAQLQVQITAIGGVTLAVVVQSVDDSFRFRYATNRLPISVISITCILVDIV